MQNVGELHPRTVHAPCTVVGRHLMHTAALSSIILWLAKPVLNQVYAGRAVERCHNIICNPVVNLSFFLFLIKKGM